MLVTFAASNIRSLFQLQIFLITSPIFTTEPIVEDEGNDGVGLFSCLSCLAIFSFKDNCWTRFVLYVSDCRGEENTVFDDAYDDYAPIRH